MKQKKIIIFRAQGRHIKEKERGKRKRKKERGKKKEERGKR